MAFTYTNGTPDQYYDRDQVTNPGRARDLWVEYKWLAQPPVRTFVPKLSDLQERWAERRWKSGKNMWVIVGFPATRDATVAKAGIILIGPNNWRSVSPGMHFPMTPKAIAAEIEAYTECRSSPSKLFASA
jgi:hypothetical protein